jgi:hypothetical protein
MALMPPSDFRPPLERPASEPTLDELLGLWAARERRRSQRARDAEWRRVQEEVRRTAQGEVIARKGEAHLPGFLRDEASFGSHARAALRAEPSFGRVAQAGVDTWSPAWYVPEGGPGWRAMEALATAKAGRARMLPDDVLGHRVGWFPDSGLVFAEGHPAPDRLACPDDLPAALLEVEDCMRAADIPVSVDLRAGVRRLDAAVDLATDSRAEGLSILTGVAALAPTGCKVVPWRTGRRVESVLFKTHAGATRARVYDKGLEAGTEPRGRLIRPEAQCRYSKVTRRDVEELTSVYVREQFRRKLAPLWDAAEGVRVGGQIALIERVREAMDRGELSASRARTVVGYLVLAAADVPQGARRTRYELERDARRLGLGIASASEDETVDLGAFLEECIDTDAWGPR